MFSPFPTCEIISKGLKPKFLWGKFSKMWIYCTLNGWNEVVYKDDGGLWENFNLQQNGLFACFDALNEQQCKCIANVLSTYSKF